MKNYNFYSRRLLLAMLALIVSSVALADEVKIPTTVDNPFDLTKGVVTSEDTHEHFTNNGLEWMRDGDNITFTLQNEQDVDYYFVTVNADTGNGGVTIDFSLKTEKGDAVADTTFSIQQEGWYQAMPYLTKTKAMKKGRYTLTLTFHSSPGNTTGNVKSISFQSPEPIGIPTDNDHPFDLTKAFVVSNSTNQHFTDYGVEYMYNDNKLIYNLQCSEDVDVCNVYVGADTSIGDVSLSLSLTDLNGEAVADTTFQIANKGWYKPTVYDLQLRSLKKGRYTLTFTFHQTQNSSWSACNISSVAFKKPQGLKPGDDVDIANAEFDAELNGWDRTGAGWNTMLEIDGNKNGKSWFNYGEAELSQTIYSLPDGLYMFRICAYDGANYISDDNPQETYIFINDQMKPMKTAFDESVSYRSIYRWRKGKDENTNFRHSADGRWVPTQHVEWNEAKAMAEHFYENCLVVPVTNGKITFGWKKTGNNGNVAIAYDHARLTYLSDKTTISETERATLETKQVIDDYKARLSEMKQALRTELAAKRPHAPQAIAEAEKILATPEQDLTLNELIDTILYVEHTVERLQLPFYEITVSSPGTLADLLAAQGIQATDTIALKLNGTINGDDVATLKKQTNLKEVDLSDLSLTGLPDNMFNNRLYMLTWVTLPKQLEAIGASTFENCPELRDLQLPATLKTIGSYAFRYSYNFYHAVIPEGVLVGSGAFRNSGIRKVTLPSSLKDVPYLLCADCYDLLDIEFNGQVNIESNAFHACYALKTVNIPEGIERLKDGCFGSCSGLTKATLPSTLLTVAGPFHNCKNLKEVTCLTAAPPYTNNRSIHGDLSSKGFTLYVPKQSVEEYQAGGFWGDFNVVGIDVLPPTISVISELTLDMTEPLPADYKPDVIFNALYYYWGNNVSSVATYGRLTVDGPETFSAGRFQTLWNPFAARSHANREDIGSTTYTSVVNYGHLRADNVTVNLCLYTDCWEFISFPFDVRVGDIRYRFPNVPLVIYGYDAQKRAESKMGETWVRMTADSILHAGRGYIFQTTIPADQDKERQKGYEDYNYHFNTFYVDALQNANKPKFFRSDDVEVTLEKTNSEFAHDRSWNFIGNPYPSYYDIHNLETTAPIIAWYFTNSYNGQYRAYSPLDDDLLLYPGQAFFIQCPLDNDKIVFHREGRTNDTRYKESRRMTRATDNSRQVYNIVLMGDGQDGLNGQDGRQPSAEAFPASETLDRTRFVINEAASLDYEPGRDASKFPAMDATATELYTIRDGVRYAIDERPLSDGTVRLGLRLPAAATYTLALATVPADSPAGSITLIDRETGTETDLTANSYTFQAEAGTTEARFLVRLNTAVTTVESVANSQQNSPLFDLQGRPVANPQPGIYVRNNKKVIIK